MPNPNFRADQNQLQPGQCTWLRWDVDGINAIFFFDGTTETGVGGHDARQVCPGATATYRLRLITQQNTEEHYALTVGVGDGSVIQFSADQDSVQPGQCTTLRWRVENVNAVYLNTGAGDEGQIGQGERQVCPDATRAYVLKVLHRDGRWTEHPVIVNVAATAAVNFWADHGSLMPGQCTTVRWAVDNVNAVFVNLGTGDEGAPGHGERQVCPGGTATYYLRVIHRDGREDVRSVTVAVARPAPPPSERRP